jgi:nucleoid DNA-binding protein
VDGMNEKTKIVTKDSLIRAIAKQSKNNLLDTKDFYNAFENVIFDILSSVNEEQDMYIKLFEGISLEGNYMEEKMKKNNFTGKVSLVPSKIKPKFNITRNYCEKLNGK